MFAGRFRDGRLDGPGGDTSLTAPDAYEGDYHDGARSGSGSSATRMASIPGSMASPEPAGRKINMEMLGLQDFKDAHWAGRYGFYSGPKIACTLIKGAVLEGSVLTAMAPNSIRDGHLIEQGLYRLGAPQTAQGRHAELAERASMTRDKNTRLSWPSHRPGLVERLGILGALFLLRHAGAAGDLHDPVSASSRACGAGLGLRPFRHAVESVYGKLTPPALASIIFGFYAGFVYLTPLAGGWVADRLIGRTSTVTIGALLMALGHFLMAFEASFLLRAALPSDRRGLLQGQHRRPSGRSLCRQRSPARRWLPDLLSSASRSR